MNNRTTHSVALAPPPATRASASLRQLWRAFVALARAMRPGSGEVNRDAAERAALAGLSAHVLRDIGASPRLLANAARCAHDTVDAARDRLFY